MVCIHLHVGINSEVSVNQSVIYRTTEGRYRVRDYRKHIDLVRKRKKKEIE